MKYLLRLLPALLTVVLGAGLLATIYFTLLDWAWIAFLGGVLFAALLALASRASQAEWRIARRNAQLARFKDSLAKETAGRTRAEEALRASEEKLRLFSDAMPNMLVYVDAACRYRFHNRAFRDWIGADEAHIDGKLMNEVLGAPTYNSIQDKVIEALSGRQVTYERTQTMPGGALYRLRVNYVPHFDGGGQVLGFFGLMHDVTERAHLAATAGAQPEPIVDSETAGRALVVTDAGGQTLYLNSMTEQLTGWHDPEARLRQALRDNEFRLFSQQIIAVADHPGHQPEYCEILIRLQEEEENLTPPGAFIPIAEQFNMTTELDCWVVRNVIDWHQKNHRDAATAKDFMYCINLFASSICDASFADFVRERLAEACVAPHVLCFELNESEAVEQLPLAARFVADLRRIGCRIALGGFGGGKVSFDTLKHLPVHFLQIDGSIVRDADNDPVNLAKMKAISRVSKAIGVRTIAQFVESGDMLVRLAGFGIDFAQGFGIDRPQPLQRR